MNKICFYNHWHNGDVFSGKGYMLDIINQLPGFEFQHAQLNSLKSMIDLPCEHIHTDQLPPQVTAHMRYIDINGTFYINTWVGAYGSAVIPQGEHHANWRSLCTMWNHIMDVIKLNLAPDLELPVNQAGMADIAKYIPSTNWTPYDIGPAEQFLSGKSQVALFCNGLVRSTQSHLGVMEDVLEQLCSEYPHMTFVCTSKFDNTFGASNLYFTDDIFSSVQNGDLNEIAYLSTRCRFIVGKNSGPFMFAHVKENALDPNKTFFSLSHRASDSYAYGVQGLPCRYYHYSGESIPSVVGHLRRAIEEMGQPSPRDMIIIED